MTDAGDIYVADLNEERRRKVLVTSHRSFTRLAGRVVVVPEVVGQHHEVPFPWRVEIDGSVFAVDLLRTVPVARLLERTGRTPHATMVLVRRAIREIT